MAIAYKSAGSGVSTETSGAACSPACPATVDAGDILIIHVYYEGTSTAPSTPTGFTLLSGPHVVETTIGRHWIYGKIAAGTEDGAANALGTAAVTTMRSGRCYSFSGYVSGSITDLVRGFSATSHATDPQMPSVTTTIAGGKAIACVVQNDNNALAAATGMSGGTWAEAVAEYVAALTPGLVLQLQTCTPTADPGTVSGGSVAATNDPSGVIGFEIRPSVPAIAGSASITLGNLTTSSTGAVALVGSASITIGNLTTSSTGAVDIVGSANSSLGVLTVVAEGSVAASGVTGDANITLGSLTNSATGQVGIAGTANKTLGTLTSSAAGKVDVAGTASKTLGALTSSATATVLVVGTATKTLGTLTVSATSQVAIAGACSRTLGALSSSAAGKTEIVGSSGVTFGALTLNASGTGLVNTEGQAAITLGALTASATGKIEIAGACSKALGALTGSSAGQVNVSGQANNNLGALTGSSGAQAAISGTVNRTLDALTVSATGEVVGLSEIITLCALNRTLGRLKLAATAEVDWKDDYLSGHFQNAITILLDGTTQKTTG